jgi:hypothetical protein
MERRSLPLEQKRIEEMSLDERIAFGIRYPYHPIISHGEISERLTRAYDASHPQTQWILDRFLRDLCGFTMEELRDRDAMVRRIQHRGETMESQLEDIVIDEGEDTYERIHAEELEEQERVDAWKRDREWIELFEHYKDEHP